MRPAKDEGRPAAGRSFTTLWPLATPSASAVWGCCLGLTLLAALGCGGHSRPAPLGGDLASLPRAASGSLLDQIPESARAALVLRDPWETWGQLEGSPLAASLRAQGLFEDLRALPWIERWEALRARLGELARKPLPDLAAMLHGAAALAWFPGEAGAKGGWLWVQRLGPEAATALEFARVLNAVHASGADVEAEEREGISLRRVRLGPGVELDYFVLADRLAVSSDRRLLERSLALALGSAGTPRSLGRQAPFADLERGAEAEGFAAAMVGGRPGSPLPGPVIGAREPVSLVGVRTLRVVGHRLTADLDPAIWGAAGSVAPELPGEVVRIDASGLDLAKAWAAVRPHPSAGGDLALLQDLDRLAGTLGRGASLALLRVPSRGPSRSTSNGASAQLVPALSLTLASPAAEPLQRVIADALAAPPAGSLEDSGEDSLGGGSLICPWGDDGPLCFLLCPSRVLASTREALLAAAPLTCSAPPIAARGPALAFSLSPTEGAASPTVQGSLRPSPSGGWEGTWATAAGRP